MHYHNKQIGTALLLVMAIVALPVSLLLIHENSQAVWPLNIIAGLVAFLFHSLNITVTGSEIKWSFGPGFWKKSVQMDEVRSVRPIKTKWYYGLGIRYTPSGWLYTVSGTTAFQLVLENGSKIILGTNDAANVVKAIESQLSN